MKKLSLFIIALAIGQTVFSQVILQSFDSKRMKSFLDAKTLFVLTGDKIFDENLKAAVSKYWKVTSHDFIPESDVESRQTDDALSFFLFNEFKSTYESGQDRMMGGLSKRKEVIYTIMNGGKKLDRYNLQGQQIGFITADLGVGAY